jgi:hypothetical protein
MNGLAKILRKSVVRAGVAGAGKTSKRVMWRRQVGYHVTTSPNVGIYVVNRPLVLFIHKVFPFKAVRVEVPPIVSVVLLRAIEQ